MMKKRTLLLIGAAVGILTAAAIFLAFHQNWFLASWIDWNNTELLTDNGVDAPEKIILSGRRVKVIADGATAWQSEREIRVQDVLWCDIDHDGEKELMLLCWRQGRYGDSRPFWVTEEETDWSQHIFIYDWKDGTIQPIWMASDIGLDAEQWRFDPVQRLIITDRDGKQTAWDWVSWGLRGIDLQDTDEGLSLTFAAVGDNLIHRQIYDYTFRHFDGNFDGLFAGVMTELERYDVTSINQETIYVDDPGQYSSYPRFGTPIQVGEAVIRAGFDIVSCATNHTLDMGTEAIDLTVDLYEQAGVVCVGVQSTEEEAYRPYEIYEQNGVRCAVFSYTEMTNGIPIPAGTPYVLHTLADEQQVRSDLLEGREAADFCVVYVHWGEEYAEIPNEIQRHWAQIFADCGADVVIGTHPHVLQPVEWVTGERGNRTLVYYSLGNFISAQTEEACRRGGLAYFTVTKDRTGCSVTDYGLKFLVTEDENGHYTTRME